ncbi:hypothetical protein [Hymenobacter psychrotolerans]|uniref:Uncharacterized protein n=1 Tax=Hymenobacter psychrotolerans DSM 18569 TaxID=1121959 RepID=A0A1M7DWL5_9BACT|nr:hypothetical protein [Hymenobacter psychrotolerans]SHL83894.1 hypothetical protein SAMN02746009_03464 [Hymenobacter psychrotolerans DSM 18569]
MLSDLTYLDTPAPLWLAAFFVSTLLLAIGLLLHLCYRADLWLLPPALLVFWWLLLQGALAYTSFYTDLYARPPRLLLFGVLPPALALGGLVLTGAGRRLLARFSLVDLTRLSVVRIPVELCLYALAARSLVPDTMTFADQNLDLAAGLTAPLAAYWFRTQLLDRRLLLIWHVGALALLLNVVVLAALSLPTPWQQMSFGQPNVAVLRLPFVWLPTFIVPLVLFSHVAALRQLLVPVAHTTARPSGRAGQWHLDPWFIDQAGNRRRTGLGRFLRPRADRKPTGPAAR